MGSPSGSISIAEVRHSRPSIAGDFTIPDDDNSVFKPSTHVMRREDSALGTIHILRGHFKGGRGSENCNFCLGVVHKPQIREQMSGPEISWYGKSILGCGQWPGLDCGEKRVWVDYEQLLRPVSSLFWGQKKIFKFFWKYHIVRTEKLHWKKVKKKNFLGGRIFFSEKPFF